MKTDLEDTVIQSGPLTAFIHSWSRDWNQFWFRPEAPNTLGAMRIFVGLIVLYTHFTWGLELSTFLGADGLLPLEYRSLLFESPFAWSHATNCTSLVSDTGNGTPTCSCWQNSK